ncbi:MAG TPA: TonB family protein [Polyangia bacterium]|jgi:metallo-beta-lactamase class B
MLASAVLAWGVPAGPSGPGPDSLQSIFEPDPSLGVPGKAGDSNKEIIRTIIRRHINEVKSCYAAELSRHPALGGRIMVQFTIAASGQVIASVLQNSTMKNAHVETCAVEAVRRWQFPKPRGGVVIISYPFVLTPTLEEPEVEQSDVAPTTGIFLGTKIGGAGAVEIETITPTLYVHRSTDAKEVPSNGLIAVAAGGLLLVDTAWTEAQTEEILAWGDGYFRRPWIGAVITHDHNDRAGGLAALERRHIPVSALDLTVAKMTARGVRGVTALFAARDGVVKDPRGFEAFYPGPGHARDNIVLHFPGLTYGGCLVKSVAADDLGFTGDADLAAWPAAIRNVSARYTDATIVPGHGPVDRSGAAFKHTLDLLAAAAKRPHAAKK